MSPTRQPGQGGTLGDIRSPITLRLSAEMPLAQALSTAPDLLAAAIRQHC